MSQSRQALRSRIKSVNSTRKITKAMEMIANAKLFKQRSRMEANREYAQRLQDTVNEIVTENPDAESTFLPARAAAGKGTFTILFCSDLGLCGGYNQNLLREAQDHLDRKDPLVLIGTSLYRELQEKGFTLLNDAPVSSDKLDFLTLKKYVEMGTEQFRSGSVSRVQLLYTRFVNTMSFQPEFDTLLPCVMEAGERKEAPAGGRILTLFEPNPETILDALIPMMINDVAYADWMESTTAEQGSRRAAMKMATDNADDLSNELLLAYNKARQAAITQEITEIVSGSNAV